MCPRCTPRRIGNNCTVGEPALYIGLNPLRYVYFEAVMTLCTASKLIFEKYPIRQLEFGMHSSGEPLLQVF